MGQLNHHFSFFFSLIFSFLGDVGDICWVLIGHSFVLLFILFYFLFTPVCSLFIVCFIFVLWTLWKINTNLSQSKKK